jgi:hypothetical protein
MSEETRDGKKASLFGLLVCRRSSGYSDTKPCDEAELLPFVCVDRRTVDDPAKNVHIGKAWYNRGRNHRVENGMICRDFDESRWMVQIADGAALQSFCDKYGKIILSLNTESAEPCYEVEIYDSYRE